MAEEVVVAPVLGTPEYDAAMAAKADAALNPPAAEVVPPATEAERPQWLPEKFKSPEELAKAYAELEQKQGVKEPVVPPVEEAKPEGEAAEAVAAAGLDYAVLSQEFTDTGALSEASYAALAEKAGLSRETVDGYIAGQQALAREAQTRAYDIAGGEEQYGNMVKWAAANLTPAEIAAYDSAVDGSPESTALAVAGLRAKYAAANGSEPGLLSGGNLVVEAQGFSSNAEMTAAMKDPRYAKDPAYRKSVEQKVMNSQLF